MFNRTQDSSPIAKRSLRLIASGLILLIIASILPNYHWMHVIRALFAGVALTIVPLWIVMVRSEYHGDLWSRLAASLAGSFASLIIIGYVGYLFGLRLTAIDYVLPIAVFGGILAVTLKGTSHVQSGRWWPTVLVVVLTIGGASLAHVILPTPPVESSYSITAPIANVTLDIVSLPITINRVNYSSPITVTFEVNYQKIQVVKFTNKTSHYVWTTPLLNGLNCFTSSIQIQTSDGSFLSPISSCH